jgi:hypothetical protein
MELPFSRLVEVVESTVPKMLALPVKVPMVAAAEYPV